MSSGKVRRSAKQAAMPAPRNFTAFVVGGLSEGYQSNHGPRGSARSLRAQWRSRREAAAQPWASVHGEGCRGRDRPGEGMGRVPSRPNPQIPLGTRVGF